MADGDDEAGATAADNIAAPLPIMTPKAPAAPAKPAPGPLAWRSLLQWLREDRLISADDATRTAQRFGSNYKSNEVAVL